jgi:hypothetical protein
VSAFPAPVVICKAAVGQAFPLITGIFGLACLGPADYLFNLAGYYGRFFNRRCLFSGYVSNRPVSLHFPNQAAKLLAPNVLDFTVEALAALVFFIQYQTLGV